MGEVDFAYAGVFFQGYNKGMIINLVFLDLLAALRGNEDRGRERCSREDIYDEIVRIIFRAVA